MKDNKTGKTYKIGVALSGGGIKGLCHAGVLKALEEQYMIPDVISGVSAGAVIGALYADGHSPDEISQLFKNISFRQMTKPRIPNGGFFSIDAFREFLEKHLRATTFEELSIPLRVVATDLDHGNSIAFSSGNLLDSIIASCSVPVLFLPQVIDGSHYVDGGVLKNFPVSTLRSECEKVIGVNASPMATKDYKMTVTGVAMRAFHFMNNSNSLQDRELCDLLIEPCEMVDYDLFGVDKYLEIYQLGYCAAKNSLQKWLTEASL